MSNQQLILRSNRFLAATLLEKRLISSEDVEKANAKLLSFFQSGKMRYASVLSILIYDLKALDESKLIQRLVDESKVGLVHLGHFDVSKMPLEGVDIEECWTTMTIPFDRIGNAICLATCYYLSNPVIEFWKQKFPHIIWYTTSVNSMTSTLESLNKTKEE